MTTPAKLDAAMAAVEPMVDAKIADEEATIPVLWRKRHRGQTGENPSPAPGGVEISCYGAVGGPRHD
jgi:hypothetical protein